MIIRLLGTGAADGIPGFFGNDAVSRYARANGGKDIRTRTAALVDDVLKIDLPPDTLNQLQRDSLDAMDWTALIFTHSDDDHIAVNELQYALIPFTDLDHLPFIIYANKQVGDEIKARYPDWPMEIVETNSFTSFEHGSYRITPIKANHIIGEDCHNLLIQRDGKTLLYATDTGIWPSETVEFLKDYHLDLLVIECTDGFNESAYHGHLNIRTMSKMVENLRSYGVLTSASRVVTTHHGRSGDARHCDLELALAPYNIEPGFDGMIIEI